MNIQNIDKAIAIMRRARHVNMTNWQTYSGGTNPAKTEEELHACGNAACFAGYVAVSPEFQADGGWVDEYGRPVIASDYSAHHRGEYAISLWLDIEDQLAESLVYGAPLREEEDQRVTFYGKPWPDVTADDVIVKLEELKVKQLECRGLAGDAVGGGE